MGEQQNPEIAEVSEPLGGGAEYPVSRAIRIPADETTPRPFPCSLGPHCRFPGSAAVHKCTACNSKPVHNLCDYPRVHHLIPIKYLNQGERDMVFVCSRRCYDGRQPNDAPSWTPPAGVTLQEAWDGDEFNPFRKGGSTTESVEQDKGEAGVKDKRRTVGEKTPISLGKVKKPSKSTRRGEKRKRDDTFSPLPARVTRSKTRSAAVAEQLIALGSTSSPPPSLPLPGQPPSSGEKERDNEGESEEEEETPTKSKVTSKGFLVHRYEDEQPSPPPHLLENTSVAEAESFVRSVSSLLHPEHRSGFYLTEGEVEELREDIDSMAGSSSIERAVYFERARASIDSDGYVVLENILGAKEVRSSIHDLLAAFAKKFSEDEEGAWISILNSGSTAKDAEGGPSRQRYMTPCKAVVEDLDTLASGPIAHDKVSVDVLLAIIAEKLHLEDSVSSLKGFKEGSKLRFGRTGLRMLLTGSGCDRQIPHLDFTYPGPPPGEPNRYYGKPAPDPDYAFIATGAVGSPILVRPRSHTFLNSPRKAFLDVWPHLVPKLVWIPPFSVFVSRGDLEHAGPGWQDHDFVKTRLSNTGMPYGHHIRVHTMAARVSSELVNDLVYAPGLGDDPNALPEPYDFDHDYVSDSDKEEESSSEEYITVE